MIDHNVDGKPKQSELYSWKTGTVTVAGTAGGTDITGISAFADLFTPFTQSRFPHKIKVEVDGAAYLTLNGGHVITLGATSSFEATDLNIRTIGVSSNGAGVAFIVYMQ